jgi:hypothetical protein
MAKDKFEGSEPNFFGWLLIAALVVGSLLWSYRLSEVLPPPIEDRMNGAVPIQQ